MNYGLKKRAARMKINTIVIITDNTVKKYYGVTLLKSLKRFHAKTILLAFPGGEKNKTIKTVIRLQTKMLHHFCTRETLIIALGGGVVGDIAGFIAATYMRGIPYIQIPTTLLAMVDSSIGGKTGINLPQGKNLMGAFYKPNITFTCLACLATLPKKHIINGLVEALKVFLIQSESQVNYVNNNLIKILNYDRQALESIVSNATKIKSDIIQQDFTENGVRAVLNLGHTIGHALEKISGYKILHGYAVAYGILLEAKISELMGILDPEKYLKIKAVFNTLGFKEHDLKRYDIHQIIHATHSDKKATSNKINYVLLKDIGKVYISNSAYTHAVNHNIVKKAYLALTGVRHHGR